MEILGIVLAILGLILTVATSDKWWDLMPWVKHRAWLTWVRCRVQRFGWRDSCKNDKEICDRFLLILITRRDEHYFAHFVDEHHIVDSEGFLKYICKISGESFSQHKYLLR